METAWTSPSGAVVVLWVAGEVDLSSIGVLRAAITEILARVPDHLVVDTAGLTFCDLRGLSLLVETGPVAAGQGTSYAVGGASRHVVRFWRVLYPAAALPARYPTAGAAVLAAMTGAGSLGGRRAAPRHGNGPLVSLPDGVVGLVELDATPRGSGSAEARWPADIRGVGSR